MLVGHHPIATVARRGCGADVQQRRADELLCRSLLGFIVRKRRLARLAVSALSP